VTEELNAETVRLWGERYSNWGRWGPDDERGTLNFITPERILAACALPRSGKVISCALPFNQHGPQSGFGGRHNPIHTMIADGGDALAGAQDFLPGGFRYAEDSVTMPLQCGTQWGSLAHVFYDGLMYGGRDIKLVTSRGARANSIDCWTFPATAASIGSRMAPLSCPTNSTPAPKPRAWRSTPETSSWSEPVC